VWTTIAFALIAIIFKASWSKIIETPNYFLTLVVSLFIVPFFMLSNELVAIFASLIAFSLGVYTAILSSFKKHAPREAGIKYYYLSAIAGGCILMSATAAYVTRGATSFYVLYLSMALGAAETILMSFLIVGFLFKLSAVPGHLWAPDVYEGAPRYMMVFLVLPSKVIILLVFTKLLLIPFKALYIAWYQIVLISCVASLVLGCLAALYERKVRRFIAYTSVNQMGYMLLGLLAADQTSVLIYLGIYIVMSLPLMLIFLQTEPALRYLTDLNVFAQTNGIEGGILVIMFFAMAGIPPLIGFTAKYVVLLTAFLGGAIVAVKTALLTTLISTFYYIRCIKIMLFDNLKAQVFINSGSILGLIVIAVLLFVPPVDLSTGIDGALALPAFLRPGSLQRFYNSVILLLKNFKQNLPWVLAGPMPIFSFHLVSEQSAIFAMFLAAWLIYLVSTSWASNQEAYSQLVTDWSHNKSQVMGYDRFLAFAGMVAILFYHPISMHPRSRFFATPLFILTILGFLLTGTDKPQFVLSAIISLTQFSLGTIIILNVKYNQSFLKALFTVFPEKHIYRLVGNKPWWALMTEYVSTYITPAGFAAGLGATGLLIHGAYSFGQHESATVQLDHKLTSADNAYKELELNQEKYKATPAERLKAAQVHFDNKMGIIANHNTSQNPPQIPTLQDRLTKDVSIFNKFTSSK
jgi:NADH-quinone oxidoreductase subunit N